MNIFWFLNMLILLAFEESVICAPSLGDKKSRRIPYKQALYISVKFECKIPQKRSYYLEELLEGTYQNTSENVDHPVCVVLHTCDKYAGCCGSNLMTCAPVTIDTYYEEMQVKIKNFVTKQMEYRWIRVEQHGKCKCVQRKDVLDTKTSRVTFINETSTYVGGSKGTSG